MKKCIFGKFMSDEILKRTNLCKVVYEKCFWVANILQKFGKNKNIKLQDNQTAFNQKVIW